MKFSKVIILWTFSIFLISLSSAFAQETALEFIKGPKKEGYNKMKIGAAFNLTSAPGLSFQYYMNDDWRLEASTIILATFDNEESSYINENMFLFTIGGEIHRMLRISDNIHSYALFGIGYWVDNESTRYNSSWISNSETERNSSMLNLSLGFGFSYIITDFLVLDIKTGISNRFENSSNSSTNVNNITTERNRNLREYAMTFGIGLYFAF